MSPNDEAESMKVLNVIDMAVTFTAMTRIFEEDSKRKISSELYSSLKKLSGVSNLQEYELIHSEFCNWFVSRISTAHKILKNKTEKPSRLASYGHAAKVFDIAVKVYVHYCHLPNPEVAKVLLPFLHGAIDNPTMNFLRSKYSLAGIEAKTIEALEMPEYRILQGLITKHIQEEFQNMIYPAQYDDIMWHRLNRTGGAKS